MRSTLIYNASVANFVIALNNFFQERGHNSSEIGQKHLSYLDLKRIAHMHMAKGNVKLPL